MYDLRIWHSRGYIPHTDAGELTQFITFRLADSMPQDVLKRWRSDLESGEITDADFRRRIEIYLDQNYGSSVLKIRRIARACSGNAAQMGWRTLSADCLGYNAQSRAYSDPEPEWLRNIGYNALNKIVHGTRGE